MAVQVLAGPVVTHAGGDVHDRGHSDGGESPVGTTLEYLKLTVRKISRYRAQGSTPDQLDIWTTLDFEAEEAHAGISRGHSRMFSISPAGM